MSKKSVVEEVAVNSVASGGVPSLTNPTDVYAKQKLKLKQMYTSLLRRKKPIVK